MNALTIEQVVADSLADIGVTIDREAPPRGRPRRTEWFPNLFGIGLRHYASGRKIYVAQTRMAGQSRTVTIGSAAVLSEAQAVLVARRVLAHAMVGNNPASTRKRERQAPTFRRFLDEYWAKASPRWKPTTRRAYDVYRRLYIDDAFEGLTIDAITGADVARWFAETTRISGPGGANQCMTILNTMMVKAEAWGYRAEGSNPLQGIRWNKRRKCERFLSVPELERLGAALGTVRANGYGTDERAAAAIILLTLTGCRKSEILDLQWPDVRGNRLRLRDGKKGGRIVWLGDDARALIDTLPRSRKMEPAWMFTTPAGNRITPGMLDFRWRRVRNAASLRGVRIHDLRHTFASHAAMTEEALPMIGKLLGHASVKSTARYAHLDDTHLIGASQKVGDAIEAMMSGKDVR
ncbi:tyrosine-type recombinase/integrase [Glacieibacterium megasporae]|uniref:tyrosine-type recombinase/integrase n=1 Tax=Glacieibacterium megasporae TaxID=2835787 RepID=UPI001C1E81D1|nr:tyrosine-type recombinase/integrase [Polymorphobacter megasporae]UAJ12482.1 site-specific integrase [Polymorphobacter megasporae]